MINSYSDLWRVDPSALPPFKPSAGRRISGEPLIDLARLQALLGSGTIDEDSLWLGTTRCDQDLRNNRWTNQHVMKMLNCLLASDYRKSEWCQVRGGRELPCDVYVLPFDDVGQQRRRGALEVYLKFSLEADSTLTITMVSCHPSR